MLPAEIRSLKATALIAQEDFLPHWRENLSAEIYHADKTAVNSGSLKMMLKSPLKFYFNFFGNIQKNQTPEMRLGTLFHTAVECMSRGENYLNRFIIKPQFTGFTKEGKESARSKEAKDKEQAWLKSLMPGVEVIEEEERIIIEGMMSSLMTHPEGKKAFTNGQAELSGYYSDPATGIRCRIRPDFWNNKGVLIDVKTVENDCTRETFSKTIWNNRYDIQMAMYAEGIEQITGKLPRKCIWVVVEREPPYEVAIYVADEILLQKGSLDYHLALNSIKLSIESGLWLPYQRGYEEIGLPSWAIRI